jgi:2-iminobutanoate/2-iminopropanoate deaminase
MKVVNTIKAPLPIGPYNQAVVTTGEVSTLYISGQIAINPEDGIFSRSSIEEQTTLVLKNLLAILEEAGMDYTNLVKTTIFLSDMAHFKAVNEIYSKALGNHFPARETVAVKGLPAGADVEISGIAVK